MPPIRLEVCVETPADAVAAERGGADRLELCSALDLGGLTPSLGTFLEVRQAVRLPVVVMIRPRAGDYCHDVTELRLMLRDISVFAAHGPLGFVFGPLAPDRQIDEPALARLVAACDGFETVFHRAFDQTPHPAAALETLIRHGITRVLTSGRRDAATDGAAAVAETVRAAAGRIQVLPCGRVRAETAAGVIQSTGCSQLHGSFFEPWRGTRRTSEAAVAAARRAVS